MTSTQKNATVGKEVAGREAAKLVQTGMIVGLGTGSTAAFFIQALIERVQAGLSIQAVASSLKSAELAAAGGIPLIDIDKLEIIDLTVDGADEIDHEKRMIKGGGGALLREKVIAANSREMVVIVDESKVVELLGKAPLPLEVAHFGWKFTKKKIEEQGYRVLPRKKENGELFITDNSNMILDVYFDEPLQAPEEHDFLLHSIPGVIETGFFLGLAGRVIIGYNSGEVEIR